MPSVSLEVSTTADPSFVRRFNEALKFRATKKYGKAKDILLALAAEKADSASVFGILGDVNWKLGSLTDAIQCFTRSIELSPKSELASLGLFHTLWESGQSRSALNEMERFLSLSHSLEYAKLLRELIPLPATAGRHRNGTRTAHKKAAAKKPARQV